MSRSTTPWNRVICFATCSPRTGEQLRERSSAAEHTRDRIAGLLEHLRALGCDQYQGFLMSPTLPVSELEALLSQRRSQELDSEADPVTRTHSKLAVLARGGETHSGLQARLNVIHFLHVQCAKGRIGSK
jgi:hypothetical protein